MVLLRYLKASIRSLRGSLFFHSKEDESLETFFKLTYLMRGDEEKEEAVKKGDRLG